MKKIFSIFLICAITASFFCKNSLADEEEVSTENTADARIAKSHLGHIESSEDGGIPAAVIMEAWNKACAQKLKGNEEEKNKQIPQKKLKIDKNTILKALREYQDS